MKRQINNNINNIENSNNMKYPSWMEAMWEAKFKWIGFHSSCPPLVSSYPSLLFLSFLKALPCVRWWNGSMRRWTSWSACTTKMFWNIFPCHCFLGEVFPKDGHEERLAVQEVSGLGEGLGGWSWIRYLIQPLISPPNKNFAYLDDVNKTSLYTFMIWCEQNLLEGQKPRKRLLCIRTHIEKPGWRQFSVVNL